MIFGNSLLSDGKMRSKLGLERGGSTFSIRQGTIHGFRMDRSRVYLFQIDTGNTLDEMIVMEMQQKIPQDLITEQAAKEHTISCQLLHKWRLSYV